MLKRVGFLFLWISALWVLAGCASQRPTNEALPADRQDSQVPSPQSKELVVMTFNVENLFDTEDDPHKDDNTFLPLSEKRSAAHRRKCGMIKVEKWREQCLSWDWNEEVLAVKLERIAKVIRGVNGGRGPDILFLQEVENRKVLERLRNDYLGNLGYQPSILTEGQDLRGIDVAILSKFKPVKYPILHGITFRGVDKSKQQDSRGILEARFRTPGGLDIVTYAVHFPAPFHPIGMREQAFQRLNDLAQPQLESDALVFAAGDFNVTSEESRSTPIFSKFVQPQWRMGHADCKEKGTNYFSPKDSWSYLDMILVLKNSRIAKIRYNCEVVRVIPEQTSADGTPQAFELPGVTGVSDHWPLLLTIPSSSL